MHLAEHALNVIEELSLSRRSDGRIPNVQSVALLDALGHKQNAGKNLGNVVSLLDAACLIADLPWLGRVIIFKKPKNDFVEPWQSWAPYAQYLKKAPLLRRWTDADFRHIGQSLFTTNPKTWWKAQLQTSDQWLQRAVLVALHQAYDDQPAR